MRLETFQMLDSIETLDREGHTLVALAHVPASSSVFEGHFPGYPIMPGVLLLETMAQAAGYLLMALNDFSRMPFFAGVKTANFRAFVAPGALLKVHAECVHLGSGYAVVSTSLACDGRRVSDARLTMRTVVFPSLALEKHVIREGHRLGALEPGTVS